MMCMVTSPAGAAVASGATSVAGTTSDAGATVAAGAAGTGMTGEALTLDGPEVAAVLAAEAADAAMNAAQAAS